MLLRYTVALLLLAFEVFGSPTPRCPKECNCTQFVVTCSTLNVSGFNKDVSNFKLVQPNDKLTLDNNIFDKLGLTLINTLSIENATIVKLDKSAFGNLKNLITVNIINSIIPDIDQETFVNNFNLKKLKLSGNNLKRFELLKSESLEQLDLSNNAISEITANSFVNIPELTYLNLANNNLNVIDPAAFSNSLNLEDVTLANNSITKLPPNMFENNSGLVMLDVSNNPLGVFNVNLTSDLEKLVLKSCQLENLRSDVVSNLDLLTSLDLSDNKIEAVPNEFFESMVELEYLDLSNNRLSSLNKELFKNNNRLQKIVLDDNSLQVIPQFVSDKQYFEVYHFSCKNCKLQSLPEKTFESMPAIVTLQLSNNNLKSIDTSVFHYLHSLIEVDLSYNDISTIDVDTFAKSTGLTTVNLAGNPLTSLTADLFRNNRVLKNLDLSFCNLKNLWIQPTTTQLTSLLQLNLTHNQLTSITPLDLNVTSKLEILDVHNNPLECSQSLRDMITWLTEHEVTTSDNALTTHETMQHSSEAVKFESLEDTHETWKGLAKERCGDYDTSIEQDVKVPAIETLPNSKATETETSYEDDYYDNYDEDDEEDDLSTSPEDEKDPIGDLGINLADLAGETRDRYETQNTYTILWPTLIFVFTALSVLVIAANIMLFILRSRRTINYPTNVNIPHVKLLQWNYANKLKKHSGSVYHLLSEEKPSPRSSFSRFDEPTNQRPAVHHPKV